MAEITGYCVEIVCLGNRQRVCWSGLVRPDVDIRDLIEDLRPGLVAETELKLEGVDFGYSD